MRTYLHSGTLGDLIYGLNIVKKISPGKFFVGINNINNVTRQYSDTPASPDHADRLTVTDYEYLEPLLLRQPYITEVYPWHYGQVYPNTNLDIFRNVLFKTFHGNYIEAYHKAFDMPFNESHYQETWLEADPVKIKPIVVSRTFRYRTHYHQNGDKKHKELAEKYNLKENGLFIGTLDEYRDYARKIMEIPYYKIHNFLEMANIIAGSELYISNQTFGYSIAMGLGKRCILETRDIRFLQNNECYFPRTNIEYF